MKYFSLFIVSSLFFLVAFTDHGTNLDQEKAKDKIQKTLDQLVRTNKIPGVNFSLIDGEGKAYNFSSGLENTRLGAEMSSSLYMLSGSIGKTYVATLVLQLVDEGKIQLGEKVQRYLPKEPWLDSIPNFGELTVEMLLSHTSGLPRWVTKPGVWDTLAQNPDKIWSYKDRLKWIFGDLPIHAPGKGWSYSDTNYILLGFLVETLEQKKLQEVIYTRVLSRERLLQTLPSDHRKIQGLAMGYSKLPESFKIPHEVVLPTGEYIFNPQMEWTGGGMASTTPDLAKWCRIYYTGDMFSDGLKQKMVRTNPNGKQVYHEKHSYGMGSFIYQTKYGPAYGHSGFMPGYNSLMVFYPDRNLAMALQINCDYGTQSMDLIAYLEKLMDSYFSKS